MVSFVATAGESVVFEAVDVGFDGAVGVAEFDVARLAFFGGFLGVAFAFFGHDELVDFSCKGGFGGGAAEAFVEADALDGVFAVLFLDAFDGGEGLGMFVGGGEDFVVEDNVVLVGGDEEFAPEFYGASGFAFGDPLGVGLEEGEGFFFVGDGFASDDTPLDEIDVFF